MLAISMINSHRVPLLLSKLFICFCYDYSSPGCQEGQVGSFSYVDQAHLKVLGSSLRRRRSRWKDGLVGSFARSTYSWSAPRWCLPAVPRVILFLFLLSLYLICFVMCSFYILVYSVVLFFWLLSFHLHN